MLSGLRSLWTLSIIIKKSTETVDVGHCIKKLSKQGEYFEFTDSGGDKFFQGSSTAKLYEAIESVLVFFIAVVSHDVGVSDFSELFHDYNLSFIVGVLLKHFFIHIFDGNNSIFA
jgi:hypothetical protein